MQIVNLQLLANALRLDPLHISQEDLALLEDIEQSAIDYFESETGFFLTEREILKYFNVVPSCLFNICEKEVNGINDIAFREDVNEPYQPFSLEEIKYSSVDHKKRIKITLNVEREIKINIRDREWLRVSFSVGGNVPKDIEIVLIEFIKWGFFGMGSCSTCFSECKNEPTIRVLNKYRSWFYDGCV